MSSRRSIASRAGGRPGAVPVCLLLALAATAGGALADWIDDYKAGVAALDRSDHDRAIQLLTQAIRDKPRERASAIKTTGMFFDPYLPHYYLGLAYYGKKDCDKALQEFRASSSQGVVAKYAEHKSRLESHLRLCEQQVASGGGGAPARDDTEARALASARERSAQALESAASFLQQRGAELTPEERAAVESAMKELSRAGDAASITAETGDLRGAVESAGRAATARQERAAAEQQRTPPRETAPARPMPPGTRQQPPAPPPKTVPAPKIPAPVPGPAQTGPPPAPSKERLSAESAARVRRGVESYYRGDDEGAISALSGLEQAQADADFYLGSALYRKYLFGRGKDQSLREEAARHFRRAAELAPGYRPDPRYVSPKVIAFFESATGRR